MTDSEIIAEWLGVEEVAVGNSYKDDDVALSFGAPVIQVDLYRPDGMRGWRPWRPDTNIALWHGGDGILQKINEKDIMFIGVFMMHLDKLLGIVRMPSTRLDDFGVLMANPAQLIAALIAVIKEDE